VGREANTAEEGERGAIGTVECEEVVKIWNIDVVVIEKDAVLVCGGFVVGHGFRVYGSLSSAAEEGEAPLLLSKFTFYFRIMLVTPATFLVTPPQNMRSI
jgi:hypothetical protein